MEQNTEQPNKPSASSLSVPVAIIIAGLLVAGSVLYTSARPQSANVAAVQNPAASAPAGDEASALKAVSSTDHILGNVNAPVKIVEFSDPECPFCKQFHETMHQIMNEYGAKGQVAWVYRHFPLVQLHSKAPREAHATECAAEIGGNDVFWKYIDRVFAVTPSNDGLDPKMLGTIAGELGLDQGRFTECMGNNRHDDTITQSTKDAMASGARGTPYSVVVTAKGKHIVLSGAQPYAAVKATIDQALSE